MGTREHHPRLNQYIRASSVRLVLDGQQMGIVPIADARSLAEQKGLDLVEIAPNEKPPVCRIMDYSKFKYEKKRREKEQRQKVVEWKEMHLSPVIGEHDIVTKINQLKDWLQKGKSVKVAIEYKGRQKAHLEEGRTVMQKVLSMVEDVGKVDKPPRMEGFSFSANIVPK